MDAIQNKIKQIRGQKSRNASIQARIPDELYARAKKFTIQCDVTWSEIIEAGVIMFCEEMESGETSSSVES